MTKNFEKKIGFRYSIKETKVEMNFNQNVIQKLNFK